MLTANISIDGFKNIKKRKVNVEKDRLLKKYPLLKSLSSDYKYSYKKTLVKKYSNYSTFRIIGMGGSILGSEAIYQFLNKKIKKKFIFINNLQAYRPKLKQKKKSLNLVISKSGNTLETIVNYNLLNNKKKNNKFIFITEKKKNYISYLANKIKAEIVEHKNYIGGRYSVLSEVGMLPANLMGLNEKKFKKFNELIKNKNFLNQLILNVSATIEFLKKGKHNSIILNYDEDSENLFKWYQQLIAESLGKKAKGILPIISTMPRDNHSLLQFYLDGPKKSFFTFFNVYEKKSDILNTSFLSPFNYLKNKSFYEIINSQQQATKNIFLKKKIPFRSFKVLKRNEESLGELFCFFILETILLGEALKINPLDQPSVELVKKETKKILC
tara:strand:+ start:1604 stop:2758 length:1155 start_codon:yes stop_codon:yes gene_type:complete